MHKYKYTNTNEQIHKYTHIQIHKYRYARPLPPLTHAAASTCDDAQILNDTSFFTSSWKPVLLCRKGSNFSFAIINDLEIDFSNLLALNSLNTPPISQKLCEFIS